MKAPSVIHVARGSAWRRTATFTNTPDLTTASAIVMSIKDQHADPEAEALLLLTLGSGVTVVGATQAEFVIAANALLAGHYVFEVRVTFGGVPWRTDHGSVRVSPGGPNG